MLSYVLVVVAVILFVIMYVHSANSVREELYVIQTNVSTFRADMLKEKMPIVLHDKIVNALETTTTLCKYMYFKISSDDTSSFINHLVHCRSRYTVLHNTSSYPITMNVIHGKHWKDIRLISNNSSPSMSIATCNDYDVYHADILQRIPSFEMILPQDVMIILPHRWSYHIKNTDANAFADLTRLHVHDIITANKF